MTRASLDYWADQCVEISNDDIADYLDRCAEDAGRDDMGRPDGVLAEAARRLRQLAATNSKPTT